MFAAVLAKGLGAADRDLLQRLEAVGGETGRHDGDPLDAVAGDLRQGHVGVGLQPLGAAEARLKGEPSRSAGQPSGSRSRRTVLWQWQ